MAGENVAADDAERRDDATPNVEQLLFNERTIYGLIKEAQQLIKQFRVESSIDAWELVNKAYLKLYNYDHTKIISNPLYYLVTVMRNIIIDETRSQARQVELAKKVIPIAPFLKEQDVTLAPQAGFEDQFFSKMTTYFVRDHDVLALVSLILEDSKYLSSGLYIRFKSARISHDLGWDINRTRRTIKKIRRFSLNFVFKEDICAGGPA